MRCKVSSHLAIPRAVFSCVFSSLFAEIDYRLLKEDIFYKETTLIKTQNRGRKVLNF